MNKKLLAHLSLLGANVIYGLNYTRAKEAMAGHIGASTFVLLRVFGALILFWLTHRLFIREKIEQKDIRKIALLAICGVAINQLMFLGGLHFTTPINASIIMISNPIVVLSFALIILKEKITWNKVSGITLGITGAAILLLFKGDLSFGSETIKGDTMILINSLSWAMFLVFVKPLMLKYNTITVMKWLFLFGLIYVTPFGFSGLFDVHWNNLPTKIWVDIIFVVVGTTFIAYLFNIYSLKALSPGVVSAYIYLQPFLATLIAVYEEQDTIDKRKVIAAVLIFIGVFLVSWEGKKTLTSSRASEGQSELD